MSEEEKADDNEFSLLEAAIAIVVVAVGVGVQSFAISKIWTWHVWPVFPQLPLLRWSHVFGWVCFMHVITAGRLREHPPFPKAIVDTVVAMIVCLIMLGMAWCVK